MKKGKFWLKVIAAAAFLLLHGQAFAITPDKVTTYAQTLVVHKGPVDGVTTFNSIAAALNSITDASATKRYVVKVMPGIYYESVGVPSFVDLQGSGTDNTTISVTGADPYATAVSLSENTTIENIGVVNEGGGEGIYTANASTVKNVKVTIRGESGASAILGSGPAEISHSKISITSGAWGIYGINVPGAQVFDSTIDITLGNPSTIYPSATAINTSYGKIYNTRINITGGIGGTGIEGGYNEVVNDIIRISTNSNQNGNFGIKADNHYVNTIRNTEISVSEASLVSGVTYGVSGAPDIANSVISSTLYGVQCGNACSVSNSSVSGTRAGLTVVFGPAEIKNSKISGALGIGGLMGGTTTKGPFKVGNSQIIGGHQGVPGTDKVFGCFDGDYNAIPNL